MVMTGAHKGLTLQILFELCDLETYLVDLRGFALFNINDSSNKFLQ